MFGFLKKLSRKSEPVAPLIPVPVAPEPVLTATLAEPEYASGAPAPTARVVAPRPVAPVPRATPQVAPVNRTAPAVRTAPVAPPRPVVPPLRSVTPVAPAPVPVAAPVAAAAPTFAAMPVHAEDSFVELPLKKLWHKLNPAVVQTAVAHPNGDSRLQVPLSLLHEQLARGAVKFPFDQFRGFAPEGLFGAAPGNLEVDIPISDILPLLKREHLARRPDQRKVSVPEDIEPIFGPNGGPAHGLRVVEPRAKGSPAPAAAPVAPVTLVQPVPVIVEQSIPAPTLPPVAAPAPAPVHVAPSISPISTAPVESAPSVPVYDLPPLNNEPIRAPKLDPSLATLKPKPADVNGAPKTASAPVAIPSPVAPSNGAGKSAQSDTFTLALMDVAAFWTEKGRNDLANLYRHTLDIPMSTLEGALKSGKLNFLWREVRPWLRLASGNTMPTLQDDLQVELPIAIIAPRFIEQRVNGKPKRKIEVGDDIPDVFEQKSPQPGAPVAPSTPVLGATAVAMDLSAALGASSKSGDTAFLTATAGKTLLEFGEIFGQPDKKEWTMSEVTQKAMTLRGVAGAVIGNSEGMLVAGSWPNGVKGDAVAAFLPQMFNRILQYTRELKLGEPGHLTLMIENVPLQIFKAGTSYFTVIGRAGENLPKAQLNAIATRLSTNFSVK